MDPTFVQVIICFAVYFAAAIFCIWYRFDSVIRLIMTRTDLLASCLYAGGLLLRGANAQATTAVGFGSRARRRLMDFYQSFS